MVVIFVIFPQLLRGLPAAYIASGSEAAVLNSPFQDNTGLLKALCHHITPA